MADTVRDLSEWWPFLPAKDTHLHDASSIILDAQLIIDLPADFDPFAGGRESFTVTLTRADTTAPNHKAIFTVTIPGIDPYTVEVPVYVGRDATPAPGGNYVVAIDDGWVFYASNYSDRLVLHPDCIIFVQAASSVVFYDRGPVNSDDVPEDAPSAVELEPISFVDGYNVAVSFYSDAVSFIANAGYGLGQFTVPPYTDIDVYIRKPGKGLRSISGHSGNVTIIGSPRAEVATEEGAQGQADIILHIGSEA